MPSSNTRRIRWHAVTKREVLVEQEVVIRLQVSCFEVHGGGPANYVRSFGPIEVSFSCGAWALGLHVHSLCTQIMIVQ